MTKTTFTVVFFANNFLITSNHLICIQLYTLYLSKYLSAFLLYLYISSIYHSI